MEVVFEILFFLLFNADIGLQKFYLKKLYNAEAMLFVSSSRGLSLLIKEKLLALCWAIMSSMLANNTSDSQVFRKHLLRLCWPQGFCYSIYGHRSCSRRYTIIFLFGKTCANIEFYVNAEPLYNPYQFRFCQSSCT